MTDIESIRRALGMSYRALAREIGVSHSTIRTVCQDLASAVQIDRERIAADVRRVLVSRMSA